MKNDLIVKANTLINASYNLEVSEQRLILMSIVQARNTETGIDAVTPLKIYAQDYAKQFNTTKETAYEVLKKAVNNLFERQFTYREIDTDNKEIVTKSRWVSRISYKDSSGFLQITFSPDVVPLITRLEKQFTSYYLNEISNLSSKYSIRLYELLISWRVVGKASFSLSDFREKIGLSENEYLKMNDFKKRVLEPAIKQINDSTNLIVKYEQLKDGRRISGINFFFKEKNVQKIKTVSTNRDPDTLDLFTKLTDKQISFFAKKLAYDPEFSSKNAKIGEEYSELENRLIDEMNNPEFVEKNISFLKNIGFKNT